MVHHPNLQKATHWNNVARTRSKFDFAVVSERFEMSSTIVRGLMMVFAMILTANSAFCQVTGKDGTDDVKGIRWDFEVTDGDKVVEKGFFRVADKVIYKGKKKVGKVEAESRTETKLLIDDFEKLNGKATLKKIEEKPPVWEGTLKRENGNRLNMKVTFKDG
jgi:hypothetical protein